MAELGLGQVCLFSTTGAFQEARGSRESFRLPMGTMAGPSSEGAAGDRGAAKIPGVIYLLSQVNTRKWMTTV